MSSSPRPARARDLAIPFDGTPGPLNAITDVPGIEIGHATLISDPVGADGTPTAVRTGVTAILPRGRSDRTPVFAAWFSLNGCGELTGGAWVEESGALFTPIVWTNTFSVGAAHEALVEWGIRHDPELVAPWWGLPVVAETWDGYLNDIAGLHVKREHVNAAIESARAGAVPEGNVGGGTGMICHGFKGGIGTASRLIEVGGHQYRLGAMVQANYGVRSELRIAGVPVGREIPGPDSYLADSSSILVLFATDAPLIPHQLKRIARRAALGLGRLGSYAANGSGDLFFAFSTPPVPAEGTTDPAPVPVLPGTAVGLFFPAAVEATEEAVVNALVAAETMVGFRGRRVESLPHDRLLSSLARHGVLSG